VATKKKTVRKPIAKSKSGRTLPAKKLSGKKASVAKKSVKKTAKPIKKTVAKTAAKKPLRAAPVAKKTSAFADQMLLTTLKVLDDRQAEDIVSINLGSRNSVADYLVIASGRAARQIAAIADYLKEAFEKLGIKHVRIEGLPEANWVLVDGGDIIVHLFRPEVRQYYNLESMWEERANAETDE
jgi:ribosome-associated protein